MRLLSVIILTTLCFAAVNAYYTRHKDRYKSTYGTWAGNEASGQARAKAPAASYAKHSSNSVGDSSLFNQYYGGGGGGNKAPASYVPQRTAQHGTGQRGYSQPGAYQPQMYVPPMAPRTNPLPVVPPPDNSNRATGYGSWNGYRYSPQRYTQQSSYAAHANRGGTYGATAYKAPKLQTNMDMYYGKKTGGYGTTQYKAPKLKTNMDMYYGKRKRKREPQDSAESVHLENRLKKSLDDYTVSMFHDHFTVLEVATQPPNANKTKRHASHHNVKGAVSVIRPQRMVKLKLKRKVEEVEAAFEDPNNSSLDDVPTPSEDFFNALGHKNAGDIKPRLNPKPKSKETSHERKNYAVVRPAPKVELRSSMSTLPISEDDVVEESIEDSVETVQSQEEDRDTEDNAKSTKLQKAKTNDAQEDRSNAEENRNTAGEDKSNTEEDRGNAEENKNTAGEDRSNAEEDRGNAEENRNTAEENRNTAEEDRSNAEEDRSNAEEDRGNAEDDRSNAEEDRVDRQRDSEDGTADARKDDMQDGNNEPIDGGDGRYGEENAMSDRDIAQDFAETKRDDKPQKQDRKVDSRNQERGIGRVKTKLDLRRQETGSSKFKNELIVRDVQNASIPENNTKESPISPSTAVHSKRSDATKSPTSTADTGSKDKEAEHNETHTIVAKSTRTQDDSESKRLSRNVEESDGQSEKLFPEEEEGLSKGEKKRYSREAQMLEELSMLYHVPDHVPLDDMHDVVKERARRLVEGNLPISSLQEMSNRGNSCANATNNTAVKRSVADMDNNAEDDMSR